MSEDEYRTHGVDVYDPNPDGSDFHVMNAIDKTLEDRGKTHGDFEENALVAQAIRTALREGGNWDSLFAHQQLALDEIALKMARIVSKGADRNFKEPWHDIEGYAKLGGKLCS